jgi:hypothetical protein
MLIGFFYAPARVASQRKDDFIYPTGAFYF